MAHELALTQIQELSRLEPPWVSLKQIILPLSDELPGHGIARFFVESSANVDLG